MNKLIAIVNVKEVTSKGDKKMKNYYRITFVTKKGGRKHWTIDLGGNNVKDARSKAETLWYKHHDAHMFEIKVRRIKDDEEILHNYFE